jgi:hypothetical protein
MRLYTQVQRRVSLLLMNQRAHFTVMILLNYGRGRVREGHGLKTD